MMRILADENCDRLTVTALRAAGHDVIFVVEDERGVDDSVVLARARLENRAVLTDDLDFGRLAEGERAHTPTVLLMRLGPLSRAARAKRVCEIVNSFGGAITGQLVLIEPGQVRIRSFGRV